MSKWHSVVIEKVHEDTIIMLIRGQQKSV